MANRYWVGGTAGWDATAGTKWSTTSGGAGGAAVPTAADDVYFDAASGAVTVTPSAAYPYIRPCRSINFTGFTGTFAMTSGFFLTIGDGTAGAGNIALKFSATMTVTYANAPTIDFVSTSATQQTVDFAGKTTYSVRFIRAGSWQYTGAHTCAGQWAQTAGTLDTNGQALSIVNLLVTAGTFNPSTSAITITGTANASLSLGPSATYTANTAVFTLNGNGGGATASGVNTNGMSLVLSYTGVSNQVTGGTWLNVTRTGGAVKTAVLQVRGDFTCTGTFAANGNSAVNRVLVYSDTIGTARTITAAAVSCSNVDFRDITGAGAGSWNLAAITGLSGDCGGNSGITFTAATTQTATGTASFTWSTHGWTTRVPLPQDTASIPNAFVASRTVTMDMPRYGTVDFTGATGTPAVTISAAAEIYGHLKFAASMGVITSASVNVSFAGVTQQNLTMAGNTFASTSTSGIVSTRSVVQLQDTFFSSSGGLGMQMTTTGPGTWDFNGFNVTVASLSMSNTSNTNLFGSSTVTLNQTSAVTILTLVAARVSAASTTFVISAVSSSTRTVALGASTIGTLTYTVAGSPGALAISGGGTIGTLNVGSSRTLTITSSTTLTVTTWNVNGAVVSDGMVLPISDSTGYATTPDSVALSITGDIDLRWYAKSPIWTTTTSKMMWTKSGSWTAYLGTAGGPVLTIGGKTFTSTANVPFAADATGWVRAAVDADDGAGNAVCRFYTSTDGTVWTQLGTTLTSAGVLTIPDTANALVLGQQGAGFGWRGSVYRVQIRNNILDNGTGIVFDADFTTKVWGADTFVESSSNAATVTLAGSALFSDGRTVINASTPGTFATLSVASGSVTSTNVTIKDNHAGGGATFTAIDSVNVSGNTGWNFVSGWVPKTVWVITG